MYRQLVRQIPPLGNLNRVNLPNQIRHRNIRRRQLLAIPLLPTHPHNRRVIPLRLQDPPALRANRNQRIAIQIAPRQRRHCLIQQPDHMPNKPRLSLPPLPQQNHILPRQNRILQLRNNRILKPDYPRKQLLPRLNLANQIPPYLFLDAARHIPAPLQLPHALSHSPARHIAPPLIHPYQNTHANNIPYLSPRLPTNRATP